MVKNKYILSTVRESGLQCGNCEDELYDCDICAYVFESCDDVYCYGHDKHVCIGCGRKLIAHGKKFSGKHHIKILKLEEVIK